MSARVDDTAPVRAGEELDLDALERFLGRPVEARQFPGGHSNLTYCLRVDGEEYVLRRPPHGPLPPKAHDMGREFRLLERIAPLYPQAPKPWRFCDDPQILGAPFYLMERREGVIARRTKPPELDPALASHAFLDALAELHAVRLTPDLEALGRPQGFLERQVRGWSKRWEAAKTEELSEMTELSRWLLERLPESPAPTLVHNDYKLDNVMFAAGEPGRVVAVLDWEMATVGDPLVDLGVMLCYWPEADDPPMRRDAISPLTTEPGWPRRADLLERYSAKTGRDVSAAGYYEVFGVFKLAVVLQQIYYRFHTGQTADERFRDFDARVKGLAEAAMLARDAQGRSRTRGKA